MKYTLLDMVQTIASSMDSDEINSISDSVESLQIAKIIRTVYFDLIARSKLPEHYSLVTLDSSLDTTKPVLMTVPSNVEKVEWIKYNNILAVDDPVNMTLIPFQDKDTFLKRMSMLDESEDNVASFTITNGPDTIKILYQTDIQPSAYTTWDDYTLIFNSYNSVIETTLQKQNTQCYGRLVIPFQMVDTFIPDLDELQFPLLLNEAKSLAWIELKQAPHPLAERNARRGWTTLQKEKWSTQQLSDFDQLPYFGRK